MNRDSINVTLINILFSETINRISIQVKHDYQHFQATQLFSSNQILKRAEPHPATHLRVFGVDQFSEHI